MSFARSQLRFILLAFPIVVQAQSPRPVQPTTPEIESTARLIGIQSELTELGKLATNTAQTNRWRMLWVHQHISEKVMAASLQVNATITQIDDEISRGNEVRSRLNSLTFDALPTRVLRA